MDDAIFEPDNKVYYECICGCTVLKIERVDMEGGTGPEFDVCAWRRQGGRGFWNSIKYRARMCWKIIRTGSPYTDYVRLSRQDANNLQKFIKRNLSEVPTPQQGPEPEQPHQSLQTGLASSPAEIGTPPGSPS